MQGKYTYIVFDYQLFLQDLQQNSFCYNFFATTKNKKILENINKFINVSKPVEFFKYLDTCLHFVFAIIITMSYKYNQRKQSNREIELKIFARSPSSAANGLCGLVSGQRVGIGSGRSRVRFLTRPWRNVIIKYITTHCLLLGLVSVTVNRCMF